MEFLCHAPTALAETRIAYLPTAHEDLTARLSDSLCHMGGRFFGDALVTLAMVVGTNIEDGMVFTVVPSDEFVVFLDEREETVARLGHLSAFFHLRQQPTT